VGDRDDGVGFEIFVEFCSEFLEAGCEVGSGLGVWRELVVEVVVADRSLARVEESFSLGEEKFGRASVDENVVGEPERFLGVGVVEVVFELAAVSFCEEKCAVLVVGFFELVGVAVAEDGAQRGFDGLSCPEARRDAEFPIFFAEKFLELGNEVFGLLLAELGEGGVAARVVAGFEIVCALAVADEDVACQVLGAGLSEREKFVEVGRDDVLVRIFLGNSDGDGCASKSVPGNISVGGVAEDVGESFFDCGRDDRQALGGGDVLGGERFFFDES